MDYVILQKGKRDTDTVRGIREKGARLIGWVRKREQRGERERDREEKKKREGGCRRCLYGCGL